MPTPLDAENHASDAPIDGSQVPAPLAAPVEQASSPPSQSDKIVMRVVCLGSLAVVLASAVVLALRQGEGDDAQDGGQKQVAPEDAGKKMARALMNEHLDALVEAHTQLDILLETDASDADILALVEKMDKSAGSLMLAGSRAREMAEFNYVDAADSIRTAVGHLKDDAAKQRAQLFAHDMDHRTKMSWVMADFIEGKAKITSGGKLVNGMPVDEWYEKRFKKEGK